MKSSSEKHFCSKNENLWDTKIVYFKKKNALMFLTHQWELKSVVNELELRKFLEINIIF